ncbi:MAG: dihydrolipoyl dehydrogenase [Candidatus Izemoplasmatales bacterium]|nr:dihydrolipoyl dehydrogenase [Candidatus Izemoplasmatales bacterium]
MDTYDLIVIGGGPGGYHGAERAAHAGYHTLLIEKRKLGGVCLNEGCIPSKAFLNSAKFYDHATHGATYGIQAEKVNFDQKAVLKRKDRVVRRLVAGVAQQLKQRQVTVINGVASIVSKTKEGFMVQVDQTSFLGKRLLIATGSVPIIPPIDGLNEALATGNILTSREILDLETIPEKLTIVGAGIIGLEMAAYFQTVGSQVTVVEMLPKIAGNIDPDLTEALQKSLEKRGVTFHLSSKVTQIHAQQITFEKDFQEQTLEHDKLLLSIGRRPATEQLGLENVGVELAKNKAIVTDLQSRTNIENVYAVGDVNGKSMLAHTAYREAEVAINTMLGETDSIQYEAIPAVVYTTPELATVGLTETEALAKGFDCQMVSLPVAYSGRHIAENDDSNGLIKLIVDKKSNTLLGAHLAMQYASEIILTLSMAIDLKLTVKTLSRLVYPHPTVGELIKDTLFSL